MADEKQQEMKKFVRILLNENSEMVLVEDWESAKCKDGFVYILGGKEDNFHTRQIVPMHRIKSVHYDECPVDEFDKWKAGLKSKRTALVNEEVQAPELRKE